MKNNLYKLLAALMVLGLAACQSGPATPKAIPALDFFKEDAARWLSVSPPTGWEAKLGGTTASPTVIVTNNWKVYTSGSSANSTSSNAIGIVILPLTDKGTAEQLLQLAIERLGEMLTVPSNKVVLEQADGQSYARVEYEGKSAETANTPAHYYLAIIAKGQRSVLVFASVALDQEKLVGPVYQSTLKAITLH